MGLFLANYRKHFLALILIGLYAQAWINQNESGDTTARDAYEPIKASFCNALI